MKTKKFIASLLLVAALSSAITVMANSGLQDIKAQINYGISIVYNGQSQTMYDAAGTQVYPITYNGTTYVPVRAVSGIFGESVEWDGATNSVFLGSRDRQPVDVTTFSGLTTTEYSWVIRDASQLVFNGSDGISTYSSGIAWNIWNGGYSVGKSRPVYFPVTGYATLSFTACSDIDAVVRVYDQDFNVVTSFELGAGQIVTKEVNISGLSQIALAADAVKMTENGTAKFFEVTVK